MWQWRAQETTSQQNKYAKHICTITRKLVSEEYIVMTTSRLTSLDSILRDCQNAYTERQQKNLTASENIVM